MCRHFLCCLCQHKVMEELKIKIQWKHQHKTPLIHRCQCQEVSGFSVIVSRVWCKPQWQWQNQYSSLTRLTAHSTMWTHAGHWKSILHLSATHSSGCINIVVTNKDNFTGAQFPPVPGWHHVSILHYTVSGHMSHHTGTGLLIMIIQQHNRWEKWIN